MPREFVDGLQKGRRSRNANDRFDDSEFSDDEAGPILTVILIAVLFLTAVFPIAYGMYAGG